MKTVIANGYARHADFISTLPEAFATGQGELVYDGRNQVRRFTDQGITLMVKRYKRVNVVQRVVYTLFRKTKACRAYLFAQEFRRRGIDTPQEVAYLEQSSMGLFHTGYFVSLEVPGTETHLLLREVKEFSPELADAVAAQVLLMHRNGILHGDLNLSNFLCTEQNGHYHFCMIDINRSHFREGFRLLVFLQYRRKGFEHVLRIKVTHPQALRS